MAKKHPKAKRAVKPALRADDKRNSGLGDNVTWTVQENDGAGSRLFSVFHGGSLGAGRRAF